MIDVRSFSPSQVPQAATGSSRPQLPTCLHHFPPVQTFHKDDATLRRPGPAAGAALAECVGPRLWELGGLRVALPQRAQLRARLAAMEAVARFCGGALHGVLKGGQR